MCEVLRDKELQLEEKCPICGYQARRNPPIQKAKRSKLSWLSRLFCFLGVHNWVDMNGVCCDCGARDPMWMGTPLGDQEDVEKELTVAGARAVFDCGCSGPADTCPQQPQAPWMVKCRCRCPCHQYVDASLPKGTAVKSALRERLENDESCGFGQDILPGDRVELHPGLDLWMRGARFGEVQDIEEDQATLTLDKVKGLWIVSIDRLKRV